MATNQAAVLEAIGDPTRRAIVELLAEGPTPVGELADRLPVSRPAVSQHLKVLKGVRLVRDEAVGTRRVYRLDPEGVAAVRSWLEDLWTSALLSFKATAEAGEKEQPTRPEPRPTEHKEEA
ncbi:MAG TPA: metalloregulator ArsR/SmtB family transcription factor [Acidimicrobiales bacterium]|nr:metalloregulator ArsR/SmtB family transcription factor [Acidimicrobiales bacterium]